jgi:hypothetical protein
MDVLLERERTATARCLWEFLNVKALLEAGSSGPSVATAREVESQMRELRELRSENGQLRALRERLEPALRELLRRTRSAEARYESKEEEAYALDARLNRAERLNERLTEELQELKAEATRSARMQLSQRWRSGRLNSQLESLHEDFRREKDRTEATAAQLERTRAEQQAQKVASMRALHRLNTLEMANMRRSQEAQVKQCAATLLQSAERRRRQKAEENAARAKRTLHEVELLAEQTVAAANVSTTIERQISSAHSLLAEPMKALCDDGVLRALPAAFDYYLNGPETSRDNDRSMLGAMAALMAVPTSGSAKFCAPSARELVLGRPEAAALGIASYLHVDVFELFSKLMNGVQAIEDEFLANGTPEDIECVEYILHRAAGDNRGQVFVNGVRDQNRNGERLADFTAHKDAVKAQLTEAHVAALRVYTTACYKSLNEPLRDMERTKPHPFPATIFFLGDAIKRLRAVYADEDDGGRKMDLWRGMRNVGASKEFAATGGSELAPMSTTSDPAVAVQYGQSEKTLLFKITSKSFMSRGADITFLSAFPGEREFLYPPLTFLRPTGRKEVVDVELRSTGSLVEFTVIEVEPEM